MTFSGNTIIECQNIGKCFQIYDDPKSRLKQTLWRGKKQFYREFWALRSINFNVSRGDSLGIIGKNGSGKSTLLQIICGTLTPTEGCIKTNGRIAALLELGSGFNPEFSGIENIYLNATMLGLSKDFIERRIEDILSFADIGDFINMPIKTYSSGMAVRLAFAVQAQIEPDILIIDEALAVGDAKFQAKCYRHIEKLREDGTSILLVTHDGMATVKHCSRAILLDCGKLIEKSDPKTVFYKYLELINEKSTPSSLKSKNKQEIFNDITNKAKEIQLNKFETRPGYNKSETRWGDTLAEITDFQLSSGGADFPAYINCGEKVQLRVFAKLNKQISDPIFGISIRSKDGIVLSESNSHLQSLRHNIKTSGNDCTAIIEYSFKCLFSSGDYFISIGVNTMSDKGMIPHDRRWDSIHFSVQSANDFGGLVDSSISIQTSFETIPD